jgi:hypothetical protein
MNLFLSLEDNIKFKISIYFYFFILLILIDFLSNQITIKFTYCFMLLIFKLRNRMKLYMKLHTI